MVNLLSWTRHSPSVCLLPQDPLPQGWKVYVSRSTGKPYWHHKDSNETRWTKPRIGPATDENAPPTQKGLLGSLDEKLKSRAPEAPSEEERKAEEGRAKREEAERERRAEQERLKEAERLEREEADRKKEDEAKRKEAYRKKAEQQEKELDLSSLVQAAASKEKETKETEDAAKQREAAQQAQKTRLLSLSKSVTDAAEKEGAQQAKEGRWWEQVEQDARDMAAGATQPGVDAAAFPVLSRMGHHAASGAASAASSRVQSAMGGGAAAPASTPSRAVLPASMEIGGGEVATPGELGLAGMLSPVQGTWDGSGGAKFHEEAGDLATAEKMYLSSGEQGAAMAADMYIRHKKFDEAVSSCVILGQGIQGST